jgi:hypothetical protein
MKHITRSGVLVWSTWIFMIGVSFGMLEWWGWQEGNTFSRYVSTVGATWPLSIFLIGLVTGIMAAHFFWPWKDNPLGKGDG